MVVCVDVMEEFGNEIVSLAVGGNNNDFDLLSLKVPSIVVDGVNDMFTVSD